MSMILYVGQKGSGKTLSVIREIVKKKQFVYTNFTLLNYKKKYHRLKKHDILLYDEKNKACGVNWAFWDFAIKKHKNFSIYLDEVHNIINSRRSQAKENIYLGIWVSQIRKILQDNNFNNLYLITQRFESVDIHFRELSDSIIKVRKIEIPSGVCVINYYYNGIDGWDSKQYILKKAFYGDKYFKYNNYLGIVKFSEEEEYV